jgi:hypothetical protein
MWGGMLGWAGTSGGYSTTSRTPPSSLQQGYTCALIVAYLAGGDKGRLELLEALIDAGADVNATARQIVCGGRKGAP